MSKEVWYEVVWFNGDGAEISDMTKSKRLAIKMGRKNAAKDTTFYVRHYVMVETEHAGAKP